MDRIVGLLVFPLLLGAPLGYAYAQIRVLSRWAGTWRIAAGLPLFGWALWGGKFARDLTVDPTSHNLFPLEVLVGAAIAAAYLACLSILRRIARP